MTRSKLLLTTLITSSNLLMSSGAQSDAMGWNCISLENDQMTCTAGDPAPRSKIPARIPRPAPMMSVEDGLAQATNSAQTDPGIVKTRSGELCRTTFVSDAMNKATTADDSNAKVNISADEVEMERDKNVSHFKGNVVVRRGTQKMISDRMDYNKNTDVADAESNVRYTKGTLSIDADKANYNLGKNQGQFDNARYKLASKHASGTATTIEKQGPTLTKLTDASYTTCDPGDEDWSLRASEVHLKHDEGRGEAWHTTVRFMGVPFLYTPYMQFPITDERMSGFLTPSFGTSSEGGADLSVPYYWNIAPDKDLTTTLRYMSDRGAQLNGEFRYLTQANNGLLNIEYLPDDDLYSEDRSLVSYLNTWNPGNNWSGQLLYNEVSDNDYFTDLSGSLSTSSITHLDRKAEINYSTDRWSASGLLETFQTVSSSIAAASRPYKRLPRLGFNSVLPEQNYGLEYMLDAEYVYFDHDINTRGHRLNLTPGISLPIETLGWFIKPSLRLNHTSYDLDNQTPGQDDSPSRTLPVFSLDSGIFLERNTKISGTDYIHTLEPRLFYLNVPYKNQTAIPVFDTSTYDFSTSQFFSENRFSGIDRIGDANQLTVALTSRLLDDQSGREVASATLGQIYYFRDRDVTLPAGTAGTNSDSNVIAALTLRPTEAWYLSGELQYDNDNSETDKGTLGIRYNLDDKHIFNVSHRFQRDSLEQTDFAFYWALTNQWRAIGRWNYSVRDEQDLEYLAGLEYQSCCWALQLVSRNYLNGTGGEDNAVIMLQLTLKGLTSLGDDIDSLLEEGILGYQRQ